MKFIHLADIHFDMPFISLNGNKEHINKRRIEQKQAFRDAIKFAKKEEVDAIFISGDLFEQKFVESNTIEYLISNLQLVPDINVFIVPGNHDPYIKTSPYKTYEWPENVTIFTDEYGKIELEEADIYGFGFADYEDDRNVLEEIKIDDEKKINILITHGTLNGAGHKYNDVKENELKKFDYVALGHIHEKKIDNSRIIYPGSLISCGFDEPGEHGFVFGEVTKDKCNVEFISTNCRQYKRMEFNVSNYTNYADVIEEIDFDDSFYRIIFCGNRNFDINELIEAINSKDKNICEIRDNTILPHDFERIKEQESLKGIFTRKMFDSMEDMSDDEKQETFKVIEYIYQMMD